MKQLVLDAFAIAARDGRAEWYRMRGSVLKNRLLDLTRRSFDEADYGFERFSDLVASLDEMLQSNYSVKPFSVELRERYRSQLEGAGSVDGSALRGRIRPDLWHAVVDYSPPGKWVWDRQLGRAVQVDTNDDVDEEDVLPTADRATFQQWRAEFAGAHTKELRDREMSQVQEWSAKGLGTSALPVHLRGRWNTTMRERVHDRLLGFFRSCGDDPPSDLFTEWQARGRVDELRSFVVRCVGLMNEQELKQLSIPAEIAMRAHR